MFTFILHGSLYTYTCVERWCWPIDNNAFNSIFGLYQSIRSKGCNWDLVFIDYLIFCILFNSDRPYFLQLPEQLHSFLTAEDSKSLKSQAEEDDEYDDDEYEDDEYESWESEEEEEPITASKQSTVQSEA